jgi:hypothetical protein
MSKQVGVIESMLPYFKLRPISGGIYNHIIAFTNKDNIELGDRPLRGFQYIW